MAGKSCVTRYGPPRADVAAHMSDRAGASNSGLRFPRLFDNLSLRRYSLSVVAEDTPGNGTELGSRSLIPTGSMSIWSSFALGTANTSFHLLMATSGVENFGAADVRETYLGRDSKSQRVGFAVSVLDLPTTGGRSPDWQFDRSFDVTRSCGSGVLGENSLAGIFEFVLKTGTSVQFILNGVIWAGAVCEVPERCVRFFHLVGRQQTMMAVRDARNSIGEVRPLAQPRRHPAGAHAVDRPKSPPCVTKCRW